MRQGSHPPNPDDMYVPRRLPHATIRLAFRDLLLEAVALRVRVRLAVRLRVRLPVRVALATV